MPWPKGRPRSPEHREKLSAAARGKTNNLGKKHSAETREKMSVAHRGERHHLFGKTLSAATRAKLSAAQRGKKRTSATRAKIGAASAARAERGDGGFANCKRGEIDSVFFQSSYERDFLIAAKSGGIEVERGKRFAYRDTQGGLRHYVPDFYLSDFGAAVEVKGEYYLARDIRKMAAAARANPSLRLVVITKDWLSIDRWMPLIERAVAGERLVVAPYAEGPARIESFKEARETSAVANQGLLSTNC